MPQEPDLPGIAQLLARHEVDCILVGGMAARLHGATQHTQDSDFVPQWSRANLERLCNALNAGGAQIMVTPANNDRKETYRRLPGGLDPDDIRHLGSFRVRLRAGEKVDILQSIQMEPTRSRGSPVPHESRT